MAAAISFGYPRERYVNNSRSVELLLSATGADVNGGAMAPRHSEQAFDVSVLMIGWYGCA
jgi:hypothetical protein